ncbi:nicotinamidase-related amidase [Kribbella rubisoli]|uniref:Nicotinamidase-related amidase n=1 Tax=Kribbella rubisoli TaxID=3075929 RepID=A0A4Q7WK47_9ACTN|nr:isochorismatase family cysteine hydrolase [Kribbella rubisoli]RZU10444.1 nicotinamidase-related amidase [Kribbella rubisoli]
MANRALLVMDVQQVIVARIAGETDYLVGLRRAIDAARAAQIPVIYVVVGFRAGHPEISSRNKSFSAISSGQGMAGDDPNIAIHPDVAPLPGDIVVTKRRVSAFTGSDLEVVLRSGDIDSLVLTGLATSGVVLSTLRQAADLDFRLTVLDDGCRDSDPEVHRVLTEKVFPRQADVVSIDEWVAKVS